MRYKIRDSRQFDARESTFRFGGLRKFCHACFLLLASGPLLASAAPKALEFERCTVKVNAYEVDAECAALIRPENPNQPDAKQIELAVVKFPSHSPNPEADAFTLIQGGPGSSSVDMAISYKTVLDDIRKHRDIIVLDQRGTGRSNKLICELPEEPAAHYDPELIKKLTKQCVEELSDHSDPRFYTTSVAVDDLEAMRIAAGYKQLNVYGVSYGTRVALHYLRKYPDANRTVILDGVVPVGLNLAGGEIAERWDQSFDALNQRCQAEPTCKAAHGNLRRNFTALRDRLKDQAVQVRVPHPNTGKPTEYTFDEYSLFNALRLMAYSTEQVALMPLLLSQAKQGDFTFLAAQLISMEDVLPDQIASGMHNSVLCVEDVPFVTQENIDKAKGTLLGTSMSDAFSAACSVWPKGVLDEDFRSPFESDTPVLILSGETDPITPPANGELAAQMLANSKHVVVPAHGHGVLARGCVPKLSSNFIESAKLAELDAACVERERSTPIFTNLTGPRP